MKPLFLPLLVLVLRLLSLPAGAQPVPGKYLTKTGRITFFSATPVEDIEARNEQVAAVLDMGAGQLAFAVPIKAFMFKRTLMQEHFNENYLESDKYPKATFTGRLLGIEATALGMPGPHLVRVEGELTMHGVTRRLQVPATLELKDGQLLAAAQFGVDPADYGIEVPLLVRANIAKEISVRVALTCAPVAAGVGLAPRPAK